MLRGILIEKLFHKHFDINYGYLLYIFSVRKIVTHEMNNYWE